MALDPVKLGDDLYRALWDPPAALGPPRSGRDSAERIADAYAAHLQGSVLLAPSAPALIREALASELEAHNAGPGGFFGAFVTAWSAVPAPTLIPGAVALVAAAFAAAAAPLLGAASAAVQAGGAQIDFARGLGAALHAGTTAILWTNPAGVSLPVT